MKTRNSSRYWSRNDIKEWADTCMEFVYKDLGYKKEQVLHATVHMDEKNASYTLCSSPFN